MNISERTVIKNTLDDLKTDLREYKSGFFTHDRLLSGIERRIESLEDALNGNFENYQDVIGEAKRLQKQKKEHEEIMRRMKA